MVTTRIVRCPSCGKSTRYDQANPDRPFCSNRCRTLDTAQWADEKFRIPLHEDNSEEKTQLSSELVSEDD